MALFGNKYEKFIIPILIIFLFLPNIFTLFYADELNGLILKKLGYIAVSFFVLIFPALFLKKKTYFILEGILCLFVAPIEFSSLYLNKATTQYMMIDSILNTNFKEAIELLSSVKILAIVEFLSILLYFYSTIRFLNNDFIFTNNIKKKLFFLLPFLLLIGFGYFFYLSRLLMTSEKTSYIDNIEDTKDMMVSKFDKIFPFDVYIATNEFFSRKREIRKNQEKISSFSFGITPKKDSEIETYILVIGETARWNNFEINGYYRNTTPNLKKEKNFISYKNCVTQANLTSNSLPIILTRANAQKNDLAYYEKTILEAFNEAGFSTSWITNQEVSIFQERIINICNNHVSLNSITKNVYDEKLIYPLDSILKKEKFKKNFIVVHTLGSHYKYNQRYPKNFEKFKPCIKDNFDYMNITYGNANLLHNAYDNSILYTDYFLSEVIKTLNKNCKIWAMIYLSDHGENLYDDENKLIMHGSLSVTNYEVHIPFFVSFSDEYKKMNKEKIENIELNRNKNITSEVVFYSMLDLANIGTELIEEDYCISNNKLKSLDSTYILNGNTKPILFKFERLKE